MEQLAAWEHGFEDSYPHFPRPESAAEHVTG